MAYHVTCNRPIKEIALYSDKFTPLEADVKFCWSCAKGVHCVTVPEGFTSDGYSMPKGTEWVVKGFTKYGRLPVEVAVLHDYLCYLAFKGEFSLSKANHIFFDHLVQEGCDVARAWVMWAAVSAYTNIKRFLK